MIGLAFAVPVLPRGGVTAEESMMELEQERSPDECDRASNEIIQQRTVSLIKLDGSTAVGATISSTVS